MLQINHFIIDTNNIYHFIIDTHTNKVDGKNSSSLQGEEDKTKFSTAQYNSLRAFIQNED